MLSSRRVPSAAGLTGKPTRETRRSRSASPDQSLSAGTSMGRRNSGRSGPVASDQAKSSAYKGVSWHKHSQKWYAYIQSGGKMRGLGYFDSQADAAKAYDAEARKVLILGFCSKDPCNGAILFIVHPSGHLCWSYMLH